MLDLDAVDMGVIADALGDQTDYEHRWLVDPRTGEVAFWTSDTGIDGQNPVDLDELGLVAVDPLPPYVWYQDMAEFADGIGDDAARRGLQAALQGRGAFRRFKNLIYQHHPDLISPWHAWRDARAQRRAVQWLLDEGLIDDDTARHFVDEHPDPALPCPDSRAREEERDATGARTDRLKASGRGGTAVYRICRDPVDPHSHVRALSSAG